MIRATKKKKSVIFFIIVPDIKWHYYPMRKPYVVTVLELAVLTNHIVRLDIFVSTRRPGGAKGRFDDDGNVGNGGKR